MKGGLALVLALLCGGASAQESYVKFEKAAFTEAFALQAVAAGMCGSLPVGTGLVNGRGWVHQPIPGPVIVRIVGPGTVSTIGQKPGREITLDMYAGRLNPIEVDAPPGFMLEWKVPGYVWGTVPVGFQLPPTGGAAP